MRWAAASRRTACVRPERKLPAERRRNNVNVIDFINQTAFVIGPSVEAIGDMDHHQRQQRGIRPRRRWCRQRQSEIRYEPVSRRAVRSTSELGLNANRWENNRSERDTVPTFKQNQFGASRRWSDHQEQTVHVRRLSGHAYQLRRAVSIQNLGYGGFYTIPTPAMASGDFSSLLGT